MKALTVWQPWASLIVLGAKPYEFRHWNYSSRYPGLEGQRIVIHAGAHDIRTVELEDIFQRMRDGVSSLKVEIAKPLLDRVWASYKHRGVLELSAGLGTAVLGRAHRATDLFKGVQTNDSYRADHSIYAWPLTDIRPFVHPIPCRGAQGFWTWPHELEAAA